MHIELYSNGELLNRYYLADSYLADMKLLSPKENFEMREKIIGHYIDRIKSELSLLFTEGAGLDVYFVLIFQSKMNEESVVDVY